MTRIIDRSRNALILLIDDNPSDILLMDKAFKRSNWAVDITTASSAEDGLCQLLRQGSNAGQYSPDLVLCDLNLPRMNGLQFLKAVKSDSKTRRIPVVMLSSSSLDKDVDDSYEGFASGYITKPASLAEYDMLVASLESYWFAMAHCPRNIVRPDEVRFGSRL